jgi:hypothetical protein
MKIKYISKFLYRRYINYKLNNIVKSKNFFKLSKVKCDIIFFNLNSAKNKHILSAYLFLLDIFYYRAPHFLFSKIFYRGKINTKVTLLSSFVDSKRKLNIFLREFFYFLFLRNFDLRQLFNKNISLFKNNLNIECVVPLNLFFFTLRNFSIYSLSKNRSFFTFFFSIFNFINYFYYNFFFIVFSFYFFLFEDTLILLK